MKLMKIRFTEWRDAPVNETKRAVTETDVAQQKLAEIQTRESEVRADLAHAEELLKKVKSEQLAERVAGQAMELDNLYVAKKAAMAAADAAGAAAAEAMKTHAKVGAFGYQVLDGEGARMLRLVDESGADLPAGVVYGYEIVDTAPALPAWAVVVPAVATSLLEGVN